jgi:hypothetical protein
MSRHATCAFSLSRRFQAAGHLRLTERNNKEAIMQAMNGDRRRSTSTCVPILASQGFSQQDADDATFSSSSDREIH